MNTQIKDNPVPSLYELLAEKVGAESVEYEQICAIINGVETNKEQPIICDVCKREKAVTAKKTCNTCYPYV